VWNNAESIRNVAQIGTRANKPAKKYCHKVFDIAAGFLMGVQEVPSLAEL
jgi:hypothetical protein